MSPVGSLEEVRREIEHELGGFPPLFAPALETPGMLEALWQSMRLGRRTGSMPALLRQKLCARLSRHCPARYALVLHCCELHALGLPGAEIFDLLHEPPPANEVDLEILLAEHELQPAPWEDWPGAGTDAERFLLRCAEFPFVLPAAADPARRELLRVLGPARYGEWAVLLVYLKSLHAWTESHPQALPDSDPRVRGRREKMERQEPRLAAYFRHYAEVSRRVPAGLGLRLQAETTRRKSAVRELDRFFKLSPDMFCIAGLDGRVRRANPAVERITGHTLTELMAAPLTDFMHPEDRPSALAEWTLLAAGRPISAFEARFRCKDGTYRWILWNANSSPGEKVLYAAGRDVTDRRAAEALLQAKVAAEEANRAKSRFLANVSHELRTPLNSVIGFANVLLKNRESRIAAQEMAYLGKIRDNGNHLLALIDRILDLSRIEAGRADVDRRAVSLGALVRDAVEGLAGAARHAGIEVRVDLPEVLAPIETDGVKLSQVLQYLIGHAVRGSGGGQVRVAVTADPRSGRPTRLEVVDPGGHIPEDRQETMFDAFAGPSTAGAGAAPGAALELTLARALCGLLGYRVLVECDPERGAVFRVQFSPEAREVVAAVQDVRAAGGPGR